ncbi:MAG: hypothetical protein IKZ88_01900 [Neisseriaceae bacterium]|nr:hypothetical protein [Neisseriaceae bacterium]
MNNKLNRVGNKLPTLRLSARNDEFPAREVLSGCLKINKTAWATSCPPYGVSFFVKVFLM